MPLILQQVVEQQVVKEVELPVVVLVALKLEVEHLFVVGDWYWVPDLEFNKLGLLSKFGFNNKFGFIIFAAIPMKS